MAWVLGPKISFITASLWMVMCDKPYFIVPSVCVMYPYKSNTVDNCTLQHPHMYQVAIDNLNE